MEGEGKRESEGCRKGEMRKKDGKERMQETEGE